MKVVLPILWTFIAVVAAYDVALTFRYASEFPDCERNPLMKWLMVHGGLDFAIGMKFLCNLLLMLGLIVSSYRWPRCGLVFSVSVAVAHACLLAFFWW